MEVLVLIALCAVAFIAYGIWEHKRVYSNKQFCEAEVVGYERYNAGGNLALTAAAAAASMVHPIVAVTLSDGTTKNVKLYTPVLPELIKQRPEFEIGGRLDVTFFGDSPQEAYLVNHPMAQTVLKFSAPLVIGISLAALDAIIVACLLLI